VITFSSAQLDALLAAYFYPLARILAFAATAPIFNNAALPRRIRLVFGLALTLAIAPTVTVPQDIPPGSGIGLLILGHQILIGIALGFVMRLVFSGIELAGELISSQMGLGFATLYDPSSAAQTGVISEFTNLCASLVFLALNGHLLMIATLAESFRVLPLAPNTVTAGLWLNLAEAGSRIFSLGLFLSLPVIMALLITNMSLAILSRAAPQLNMMAMGFPITMLVGFVVLALSLSYWVTPLSRMFMEGIQQMLAVFPPPSIRGGP